MRKIRNPRYAPESLERKLSPTAFLGGLMPTAEVATSDPTTPPPLVPADPVPTGMGGTTDPGTLPGTGVPTPDTPPILPPTGPIGPA